MGIATIPFYILQLTKVFQIGFNTWVVLCTRN